MCKPTTQKETVEIPRTNRSHALSGFSQQCSEADAIISLNLRAREWKLQEIELLIQVPCLGSDRRLAHVTTPCCYPAWRLPGPAPVLGRKGTGARPDPSILPWATGWITKLSSLETGKEPPGCLERVCGGCPALGIEMLSKLQVSTHPHRI